MSMQPFRVLISDQMSKEAIKIFKDRGVLVDDYPDLGKNPQKLHEVIGNYDGLAIRSATQVTPELIDAAKKLKIIGRAGIGTDNVDLAAASRKGILVMNTPFGNSVTTAEHALAMMFALARELPAANLSTHQGKWEKNRFMGVEITGKTLGVLGCGTIGSLVATRAVGLGMRVLVSDPFVSEDRARELGVQNVSFDELLEQVDFLTIHTPLTDRTRNIIDEKAISKMKNGVRIVNCARGGLICEKDLALALRAGKVAGAALDVFENEPARENELFGLSNVICTPHLGASTVEAQENVALQIAEQISDYLQKGIISNGVNIASVSSQEAPHLKAFMSLAENLGSFLGQILSEPVLNIEVLFDGSVSQMNTSILRACALTGLIQNQIEEANIISAPFIIKERAIPVAEVKRDKSGVFNGFIRVLVKTPSGPYSVSGTCHSDGQSRFIDINSLSFDILVTKHMLYVTNKDTPGIIGLLGAVCGSYAINIANFHLGRNHPGGDAIAILSLDAPIPAEAVKELENEPSITTVRPLYFKQQDEILSKDCPL